MVSVSPSLSWAGQPRTLQVEHSKGLFCQAQVAITRPGEKLNQTIQEVPSNFPHLPQTVPVLVSDESPIHKRGRCGESDIAYNFQTFASCRLYYWVLCSLICVYTRGNKQSNCQVGGPATRSRTPHSSILNKNACC